MRMKNEILRDIENIHNTISSMLNVIEKNGTLDKNDVILKLRSVLLHIERIDTNVSMN